MIGAGDRLIVTRIVEYMIVRKYVLTTTRYVFTIYIMEGVDTFIRELNWNIRYSKMLKMSSSDGLYRHPLYSVWRGMLNRCYNPNSSGFPRYGARGISVCDEWMSMRNFVDDMKQSHGLTLDRIDPNGDYSKDNCRWASMRVQASNLSSEDIIKRRSIHTWVMKSRRLPNRKVYTKVTLNASRKSTYGV